VANPQLENGFTPVANELVEALCRINLSAYEHRVLFAILRCTYGWSKKADRIAVSQFAKITRLKRRHIARALDSLKAKKLILVMPAESRKGNTATQYAIQKDWQEWEPIKVSPKEVTLTNIGNSHLEKPKVSPKEVIQGITNPGAHNNNVKTNPKKEEEERGTSENFLTEMSKDFPELDIKDQLKSFTLYWQEGNRKLKHPRFAFRNWLKKAREIKARGGNGRKGEGGRHLPKAAELPEPEDLSDPSSFFRQNKANRLPTAAELPEPEEL